MVNQYGLDVSTLQNDAENFNQTPLFEACAAKDQEKALILAKFFIGQGVSPTQQDRLNQLPLYYAVREGHTELIDLLLSQGSSVNHLDIYGQNPIFYCVREGNLPTTQQLIDAGSHVDLVDENGHTPIYYAIK